MPLVKSRLGVSTYCILPLSILTSRRCIGSLGELPAGADATVVGTTDWIPPVPGVYGCSIVTMRGAVAWRLWGVLQAASAAAMRARGIRRIMVNPPSGIAHWN